MSLTDVLDRSFAPWNDHDPDAVVRSLAHGGSYQDPTTGGPLTGDALVANVATLLTGFPDLHFDLVSVAPTGDTAAAAQWLMRGTNTGPATFTRPKGSSAWRQFPSGRSGTSRRPTPLAPPRSSSSTASGCCRAAGPAGRTSSSRPVTRR
jgi:hypothetical protein